jgi:hypothetical protein
MRATFGTILFFAALTLLIVWPLPTALATRVPGDFGDPLFISWVMSWVAQRLSTALTDPLSLTTFWDAPIFRPETGALTFSEHFIPQTVMVLPVYWLTHNLILSYNVAFLLSYVLTGTGTALLTRALTGSLAAGLFAGIVAAFNEYRLVWEVAHLQTLSVYWLPFVLLGIHRYLVTGKRWPLAGAGLSWIALNLSSVYYLAYCSPFVALFALIEMVRLGRWRNWLVWRDLTAATVIVFAMTAPFVWPYMQMQQRLNFQRTPQEVITHSATIDAYVVALPRLTVPLVLAALSLLAAIVNPRIRSRRAKPERAAFDPLLAIALGVFAIGAVWLSLGPVVQWGGRVVDVPAIYPAFARLPGYSGLRVPARFASLFLIFLGMLAGLAVQRLGERWPRLAPAAALIAASLFLWQGRAQRVPLDQPLPSAGLAPPPAYLAPSPHLPAIYQAVTHLPATAVVAEFPFGDPWYDVRYMFFAATHHRAELNGYSGVFPPSYRARQSVLGRPFRNSDRAWVSLDASTHVIVHNAAWPDDTGPRIGAWLVEKGAVLVGEVEGASFYKLRDAPQ